MYKGASQSLQRAHAVDKPHPSKGYIDAGPDPRDIILAAEHMTLEQAKEESAQLALEIARAEQDAALAWAAGKEGAARAVGRRKCVLQSRMKAVNVRIKDINRQNSGDAFRRAVKDVVSDRMYKRIIARAMELNASADTLPKGQDPLGLAGTESGAVPEGQTPSPSPSPAAGR